MRDQQKVVKPMDDGIRERAVGAPSTNSQRVCWAIKTLVAEVTNLFPETTVEYSNYDGRNTALDATFDISMLDADTDRVDAMNLLALLGDPAYNVDPRVDYVITSAEDAAVLVSMKASLRTQDSREPFGLADAYEIFAESAEPQYVWENDETGGSL